MASSQLPYQCLKKLGNLLVAARGSSIDLLNAADGTIISSWDCPPILPSKNESARIQENPQQLGNDEDPPPAKKRKVSAPENEEAASVPKDGKKKKINRSEAVTSGLDAPAVIIIEVTQCTQHVVAVTGEDKCIRVFELLSDSGIEQLKQLSQRAMPKRPCALAITADESTIISADKFGDVYSLPLLYSKTAASTPAVTQVQESQKPFVPAANELTIHSKRNLKALENQKRQTNKKSEKSDLAFEHTLLLGHVSMLTDVKLAALNGREYIISADRDEHIRISRGLPQAHIIEGFCLGHSDFVSRVSISNKRPDILISGGGDDQLFVWNWESGQILSRTNLMKHIASSWSDLLMERDEAADSESNDMKSVHEKPCACPEKLAVSGIYHVHCLENASDIVLVTCEAIPAIITFTLTPKCELEYIEAVKIPGNVLAIATDVSLGKWDASSNNQVQGIVVSVDNIHKRGFRELQDTGRLKVPALHKFALSGTHLISHGDYSKPVTEHTYSNESPGTSATSRLTNLLYALENLRKRGEEDIQEE